MGGPPLGQRLGTPVQNLPRSGAAGPILPAPGSLGQNLSNHLLGAPAGNGPLSSAIYQWTAAHPQPFSKAWYAQHPNAWKIAHPYAGPAAAAVTTAAIATWFAVPATAGGYTTVVTEGDTYVGDTYVTSEPSAAPNQDTHDASIANNPNEWMDLGVFTLKPMDQANATRMLQLAVAKDGTLRGSHYDLLSEETDPIQGSVDKEQLEATWTIGNSHSVSFNAPLDELTKPVGNVMIHLPDGKTVPWVTERVNP